MFPSYNELRKMSKKNNEPSLGSLKHLQNTGMQTCIMLVVVSIMIIAIGLIK
jgi:hypothetical protein